MANKQTIDLFPISQQIMEFIAASSDSSDNTIQAPAASSSSPSDAPEDSSLFCNPCDGASNEAPSRTAKVVVDRSELQAYIEHMEQMEAQGPVDRLVIPSDVVPISSSDEAIVIIGTRGAKVTKIMGLEGFVNLQELVLRSCLLSRMTGVETLVNLTKLELYDNHIEELEGLEHLKNLVILDISFNSIRDMSPVAECPKLQELYIAQNKLRQIDGLEGLSDLRLLDLGANRIRSMDGIEHLTSLESLWLGKNKIESLMHVGHLPRLRQLDVQNNRLTSLGDDLAQCSALQELYLACNAIPAIDGKLPVSGPLRVVDLSSNHLRSITGICGCQRLEEVWMTASDVSSFEELTELTALPSLSCVYLEHSPIWKHPEYTDRLKAMIPTLTQIDALEL